MGWSLDILKPELNRIFREAKRKYRVTHPQSPKEAVIVEYEGEKEEDEIAQRFKVRIVELFPEFVFVEFVVVPVSEETSAQMTWWN